MIQNEIILAKSNSLFLTLVPTAYAQKDSFIVEVTFIDSSRNGLNDISFYIEEYPEYLRDNIDLIDAMYDDDLIVRMDSIQLG
jgi:hypothetical protein